MESGGEESEMKQITMERKKRKMKRKATIVVLHSV